MKFSKSAEISISLQAMVTIILAVVILLFSASALGGNRERLVSSTEDLACQAYLQYFSSLAGKTLSRVERITTGDQLFAEFTRYCRTERLYIEGDNQYQIFDEYAQAATRCYKRYGSGDLQFLDFTQREGSYCFVCAKVSFEDKEHGSVYKYKDLAQWMNAELDNEENIPNQGNDEKKTYGELSNMFYTTYTENSEGESLESLRSSLSNKLNNEELANDYGPLLIETSELFNYLYSVENRIIHPQETQYVVFRYNLDDSSFEDASIQVGTGIAAQAALGFGVKRIACYAAAGIVTATGLGAPVGAAIAIGCTVSGGISVAKNAYRTKEGVDSIREIQEDVSKFFPNKLSQDELKQFQEYKRWLTNNDDLKRLVNNGGRIKIPRKIEQRLRGSKQHNELTKVFDDINNGRVRLTNSDISSNSPKFQNIRNLLSTIIYLQTMQAMEDSDLPSYKQYTEIIPESEFYEACGSVPNYE